MLKAEIISSMTSATVDGKKNNLFFFASNITGGIEKNIFGH